jgi:PAS domain S-box-containing protein
MNEVLNVLCLEDSPQDAEIMRELLIDAGYDLNMDCTAAEKEFVSLLRSHKYDLILSDFKLPGFDGFAALKWSVEICPEVPFICVSGTLGDETAVELLKKGAVDYVLKNNLIRLPSAIQRALEEAKEKEAHQQADKALNDSELRYRRLFEAARDGILILDAETGMVVDVNPFLIEMLGYSREQFMNKRIWELGFCKDIFANQANFEELREKKYIRYDDRPLETIDRRRIEVEFVSNVYQVNHSKVIQCNIRDITERKHAEEGLRESERRLREAQEMAHLGFWTWDIKTGNVEWSEEVFKIFCLDPKDFIPQIDSILALSPWPEDHQRDKELINRAIETHSPGSYEQMFLRPDKGIGHYYSTFQGNYNEDGNLISIVGTVLDITERKQAEEAIKILNIELEQRVIERTSQLEAANKELEAFSYSVSHDLRAPLRAVDGFSKFILEDYEDKLDSEGKRFLKLIRSNTQKMDQLITDLLALSRVARNELNLSGIDMTQMATSMFNEITTPDVSDKISFKVDPLPEAYADPTYLRQVWANLIANAIKFSSKEKKPSIKICGRTENGFNVYYVKDNGVGFNPEYAHKLFGVFQRLHKSDDFEGTGVGLAIVQRIIHRHGGKVWAESVEGKGATFYFSLPVK